MNCVLNGEIYVKFDTIYWTEKWLALIYLKSNASIP